MMMAAVVVASEAEALQAAVAIYETVVTVIVKGKEIAKPYKGSDKCRVGKSKGGGSSTGYADCIPGLG